MFDDIENLKKFKEAQSTTLNLNNWHEYINCVYEAGYRSSDMLASENVFAFGYGFFFIGKELGVQKRELRKAKDPLTQNYTQNSHTLHTLEHL